MKKLLSIILLALPVTVMAGNFTGNEIRVSSEAWKKDKDGKFSTIDTGTDIRVTPSYYSGIDVKQFEMGTPGSDADHFWEIDFHMDGVDSIDLTFTNPELSNETYQYDYDTDLGFHFHDVDDTWRPIAGVSVSTPFAPKGFDPSLIRFDENNIYVNLKGSSCVTRASSNSTACGNVDSPTGLNNIITLNVEFEGDPNVYRMGEIDLLFDWFEDNFPQDLPSHQESFYSEGSRIRYYPSNNGYLYVENLHVYFYKSDDYMAHYGTLDYWLYHSGIAGEEARKKEARRQEALQEEVWEYDAHQEEDEWDE